MKSLFLTATLFLAVLKVGAQSAEWIKHKNGLGFESFFETTYIASETAPFIVSEMYEQPPGSGGGGGSGPPPPNTYITGYDTTGALLWNKKIIQLIGFGGVTYEFAPTALMIATREQDKFWMVIGPSVDTIKIGSQLLTSPYNDDTHHTYYFVEMNKAGNILNHFTYSMPVELIFVISDVAFETNGDFVVSGSARPNVDLSWASQPFSFGTYSTVLGAEEEVNFIARIHDDGTAGEIFPFKSDYHYPLWWAQLSHIDHLAVNSNNGHIGFIGMLGDTLIIDTDTMVNTSGANQFFLGEIDANFNYVDSKDEYLATSGALIQDFEFSPTSNSFYFCGPWDGLLSYGQTTPFAGCPLSLGNDSYIAKLKASSLEVDEVMPVLPYPHSNANNCLVYDLDFAEDGALLVAGFTDDSIVSFGTTNYHLDNASWNEFPFFSRMSPTLTIDTTMFAETNGISRFNAVAYGDNSIYLGGSINGTLTIDGLTVTSTYQLDASLLRLDQHEFGFAGVPEKPVTDLQFTVRPNPSNGYFEIVVAGNLVSNLIITNSLGQTISTTSAVLVNGDTIELNLTDQENGIYFVILQTETETVVQKIMLRK